MQCRFMVFVRMVSEFFFPVLAHLNKFPLRLELDTLFQLFLIIIIQEKKMKPFFPLLIFCCHHNDNNIIIILAESVSHCNICIFK